MRRTKGVLGALSGVVAVMCWPAGHAQADHMTAQGRTAGAFVPWGFNDAWFTCAGTTACTEINVAGEAQPQGNSTARFKIQWQEVYPTSPTQPPDWSDSDAVFAAMRARGMVPVMEISNAPAWSHPGRGPNTPPDLPEYGDEYREFIRLAVERYAGGTGADPAPRVAAVEIWNEPNHPSYWINPNVAHYVELLEFAAQGVGSATVIGPKPPVLIGGLAAGQPGGGIDSKAFLEEAYNRGAAQWADGVAIHPYPYAPAHSGGPPAPPATWVRAMWDWDPAQNIRGDIERLEAVRDREDPGACFWITEVGVPARWLFYFPVLPSNVPTEAQQGPILHELYASLYGHGCIKSFIIHSYNDAIPNQYWGAMFLFRPENQGGGPRPAFCYLAQRIGNPVC